MNPFKRRSTVVAAAATCGLAAALVLSGCSAGQVSQTATQEPAINGTSAHAGPIVLRNIHISATQTTAYIEPGNEAQLVFVAANTSPDVADKLVSVSSDIGNVTLTGGRELPVNGLLVVGSPDGQTALSAIEPADAAEATVAAVDRGGRGVYNIVDDDPAPVAEWLPELAAKLGAGKPMRVPRFIGRLAAGQAGVVLMTELRGASNAKAKRELGWRPTHPTWRQGLQVRP